MNLVNASLYSIGKITCLARRLAERSTSRLVSAPLDLSTRRYTLFHYIMSFSDAITTFSEFFDASSRRSTSASTLTSTYPDFDAYMRKIYFNTLTSKSTPFPVGRKRHSKSNCKYICSLYSVWSSGNRAHVNDYLIKVHFPHASKPDLKQPSITSVFNTINSTTSLRYSFNKERYKKGVIGLFTRRRVLFSLLE